MLALKFDGFDGKVDCSDLTLAVLTAFMLTREYDSVNTDGYVETLRRRSRSSWDIWRHLKYFDPSVKLMDVKRELFKIVVGGLECPDDVYPRYDYRGVGTVICWDIRKRVFFSSNDKEIYDPDTLDEYRDTFSEWENSITDDILVEPVILDDDYEVYDDFDQEEAP